MFCKTYIAGGFQIGQVDKNVLPIEPSWFFFQQKYFSYFALSRSLNVFGVVFNTLPLLGMQFEVNQSPDEDDDNDNTGNSYPDDHPDVAGTPCHEDTPSLGLELGHVAINTGIHSRPCREVVGVGPVDDDVRAAAVNLQLNGECFAVTGDLALWIHHQEVADVVTAELKHYGKYSSEITSKLPESWDRVLHFACGLKYVISTQTLGYAEGGQ